MDWTTIQKRLAADSDSWAAIARATGLTRMTIARIGAGVTPSPRMDTALKIAAYYKGRRSPKSAGQVGRAVNHDDCRSDGDGRQRD